VATDASGNAQQLLFQPQALALDGSTPFTAAWEQQTLAGQAMNDADVAMLQAVAEANLEVAPLPDAVLSDPAADAVAADDAVPLTDDAAAPAAATHFVISIPATTIAGESITATVTAYDADGNLLAD